MKKLVIIGILCILLASVLTGAVEAKLTRAKAARDIALVKHTDLPKPIVKNSYAIQSEPISSRAGVRARYANSIVKRAELTKNAEKANTKVASRYQTPNRNYERPPTVKLLNIQSSATRFSAPKPSGMR